MKDELRHHFIPLLAVFFLITLAWIVNQVSPFHYVYLFFGFLWGSFFLDIDHFVYWYYLQPKLEESQQAQTLIAQKDISGVINLLQDHHKQHTSLIFHHYFFQVVLALTSIFVFTSSASIFTKAFLLALNLHLIVDEVNDYLIDQKHLQDWLFAREKQQLPIAYLKYYIGIFILLSLLFFLLLIGS